MVQSQFSISWDSFNASICGGFSSLQQNGELVDMTLAADGHFVKVHQVLMALVSPYLKQLITSAPCQHPVIFLNNVSHKTLSLLLQYVYTGVVSVPTDDLAAFSQTARALHIKGLEQFPNDESIFHKPDPLSEGRSSTWFPETSSIGTKRPAGPTPTYSDLEQTSLPAKAKNRESRIRTKSFARQIKPNSPVMQDQNQQDLIKMQSNDEILTKEDDNAIKILDRASGQDSDDDMAADSQGADNSQIETAAAINQDNSHTDVNQARRIMFTVSNHGFLQAIYNRYVYHYLRSNRVGHRRWRCVDLRHKRCPAYLITDGNVVLSRGKLHNHEFHDQRILQKMKKEAVFAALEEVERYKERVQF